MKYFTQALVASMLLQDSNAYRVDLKPSNDGISPQQTISNVNQKFDQVQKSQNGKLSVESSMSSHSKRSKK